MSWTPLWPRAKGLAIGSVIVGLVSIPLATFPFDMFLGPIAIGLGVSARRHAGFGSAHDRLARTGILFGAVGTIIWVAGALLLMFVSSQ